MQIINLEIENFRNLEKNKIEFSQDINVIYGDNAQGKTNLLEALWLFCGGHSFRGAKDSELINFNEKFAKIKAEFLSQERVQTAEIIFKGNKKEVFINQVKKNSSASLIGKYTAVIFSPEDLSLVKRGPQNRRKFIDSAICREKIKNAVIYSKYNQTLNQRNALLKDIQRHPELKQTLEIWDDTLCILGGEIIFKRLEYVKKLTEKAKIYHNGISDKKEDLLISYICTCNGNLEDTKEEIIRKFKEALNHSRKEDIYTGYTTVGPHRDDIDIIINGKKVKMYGSQGQQRSAVLSLKLAEAGILKDRLGENPIILLDDVLSELDKKRRDFLINKIKEYQVFITSCEKDIIDQLKEDKCFYVKEGKVE